MLCLTETAGERHPSERFCTMQLHEGQRSDERRSHPGLSTVSIFSILSLRLLIKLAHLSQRHDGKGKVISLGDIAHWSCHLLCIAWEFLTTSGILPLRLL